jgi:hypothetical protein
VTIKIPNAKDPNAEEISSIEISMVSRARQGTPSEFGVSLEFGIWRFGFSVPRK